MSRQQQPSSAPRCGCRSLPELEHPGRDESASAGVSRRLFAVALLPPEPVAARVEALRTALGDPRRFDLPAHLTLVPPIDLDGDRSMLLPAVLRSVARSVESFTLHLGPATTFAPRTMTLHLEVTGDLERLGALRDALRVAPLDRPDEHEFVPHVTLLQRARPEQVQAGTTLLAEPVGEWRVDSLHLLERLRPESGPIWHPVAQEPLGGPDVVGRGGIELHLRTIETVEPAVADLLGVDRPGPLPAGSPALVVAAEPPGAPGAPVGVAVGRADAGGAVLERVAVAASHRRQGVARQVVTQWCRAAADRGAGVVVGVRDEQDAEVAAVADSLGFVAVQRELWIRRVGPLSTLGALGSPP